MERHILKIYFIIFFFAFLVRVGCAYIQNDAPFPDQAEYIALAEGILTGNYDTTFRTPGYPLFIAIAFSIFGKQIAAVKIAQMLLDIVTLILIHKIAQRLFDEKTALLASLGVALYPFSIYYSGMIATETLFTFCVCLSIYLMIRYHDKRCLLRLLFGSVVVSYGIYVRPTLILFALFCGLWLLFLPSQDKSKGVAHGIIFLTMIAIFMLPQLIANYSKTGYFIFTSWGGVNFFIGNNPQATGSFYGKPLQDLIKEHKLYDLDEVERYRFYIAKGFNFIRENPQRWLGLMIKKFYLFWNPIPALPWPYKLISMFSYGFILPLSIYGFLKSEIEREIMALFSLMFSSICLASLICFSLIRLRNPIDPLLIIFASNGFRGVISKINRRVVPFKI